MNEVFRTILIVILGCLFVPMVFGLIRAIRGPRRADRILGINMATTLSTAAIAVISILLNEGWLLDVCLVYCLISFLAVVVLAKVHISEAQEAKEHE